MTRDNLDKLDQTVKDLLAKCLTHIERCPTCSKRKKNKCATGKKLVDQYERANVRHARAIFFGR